MDVYRRLNVGLGSKAEVQPRSRDVRCWGKSGSQYAVWKRVVKAVEKLLSKERPDGGYGSIDTLWDWPRLRSGLFLVQYLTQILLQREKKPTIQTPFVRLKRMRVVGGDPWETDQPDSPDWPRFGGAFLLGLEPVLI